MSIFVVALKSHKTTSFDFVRKHSIVKPDVIWDDEISSFLISV